MRASLISAAVVVLSCVLGAAAVAPDPDVTAALRTAEARAARGDVVAQFSLAEIEYYQTGGTAHAIEWLHKAAAQRYPPAEFHLGQIYDFGLGAPQSDAEALGWYRRAAEHGHPAAQRAVGDFYRQGRGVAQAPAEAARWYRRGADGDDLRAQYQLGQLYFDGTGIARDYASAYVWFTIAAQQTPLEDNRKGLLELRNIAAARMTPAAEAAAARRVKAWRPAARR
jgi:TPR repeat protein